MVQASCCFSADSPQAVLLSLKQRLLLSISLLPYTVSHIFLLFSFSSRLFFLFNLVYFTSFFSPPSKTSAALPSLESFVCHLWFPALGLEIGLAAVIVTWQVLVRAPLDLFKSLTGRSGDQRNGNDICLQMLA